MSVSASASASASVSSSPTDPERLLHCLLVVRLLASKFTHSARVLEQETRCHFDFPAFETGILRISEDDATPQEADQCLEYFNAFAPMLIDRQAPAFAIIQAAINVMKSFALERCSGIGLTFLRSLIPERQVVDRTEIRTLISETGKVILDGREAKSFLTRIANQVILAVQKLPLPFEWPPEIKQDLIELRAVKKQKKELNQEDDNGKPIEKQRSEPAEVPEAAAASQPNTQTNPIHSSQPVADSHSSSSSSSSPAAQQLHSDPPSSSQPASSSSDLAPSSSVSASHSRSPSAAVRSTPPPFIPQSLSQPTPPPPPPSQSHSLVSNLDSPSASQFKPISSACPAVAASAAANHAHAAPQASRPKAPKEHSSASDTEESSVSSNGEEKEWACLHCTMMNRGTYLVCSVCLIPRVRPDNAIAINNNKKRKVK